MELKEVNTIIELEGKIRENLINLHYMLELMEMEEYENSQDLQDDYNKLYLETEALKKEYCVKYQGVS